MQIDARYAVPCQTRMKISLLSIGNNSTTIFGKYLLTHFECNSVVCNILARGYIFAEPDEIHFFAVSKNLTPKFKDPWSISKQ